MLALKADRSVNGPLASTELVAQRLETGEMVPAEADFPSRETLLDQLKSTIISNRFGFATREENDAAFESITRDESGLQKGLERILKRARDIERLLVRGGNRSTGQLFDYESQLLVSLMQLVHPRLHR